jgi:hypothetical protein
MSTVVQDSSRHLLTFAKKFSLLWAAEVYQRVHTIFSLNTILEFKNIFLQSQESIKYTSTNNLHDSCYPLAR